MAKTSGLGQQLLIGGYNVSGDIGSLQKVNGGNKPLIMTGIDKLAFERQGGKRDGGLAFSAYFNPSAGQAHAAMSTLPTADVIATYNCGTAQGSAAAVCTAKQ